MKTSFLPFLLLIGTSALWARHGESRAGPNCACAAVPSSQDALSLSEAEAKALSFQIDEERMAGELYRAFGRKWALRPFQNIPRAEDRHHALLQGLASRAGMDSAVVTTAGHFETAEVQARYDTLLARGEISLIEALKTGALVEEQDVADLHSLVATTANADLKSVAAVLEAGSQNHLRAFTRNLKFRGVDYTPQILLPEEFAAIIAAGH